MFLPHIGPLAHCRFGAEGNIRPVPAEAAVATRPAGEKGAHRLATAAAFASTARLSRRWSK
jgi:hypothetical protein